MMNYVKHFWPPFQEGPIIGFKLLDILLQIPVTYKLPS